MSDATRFEQLRKQLNTHGIPTEKAGFFDHPAFVAVEKRNGSFLEQYARFVHWSPLDAAYLQRAEAIIKIVAEELHRGLVIEGRLGGCIDTSMTMGRILDLYGVWNYVVRGGLKITFPATSGQAPFGFIPMEIGDGSGKQFGHKWLAAPPYSIIDVTLKLQEYERPLHKYLPDTVMAKPSLPFEPKPEDILSRVAIQDIVRQGGTPEMALNIYCPAYRAFKKDFPGHLVEGEDGLKIQYFPVGVGGSDCSLKKIISFMVKGRNAYQFYEEDIKPKLAAVGFEETLDESEFPGGMTAGFGARLVAADERPGSSAHDGAKPNPRERAAERKKKKKRDKQKGK